MSKPTQTFLRSGLGVIAGLGVSLTTPWASAEERLWIEPDGGSFNDPANWDGLVPGEADTAVFALNGTYAVTFGGDVLTDRLLLRDGNVAFMLKNAVYNLLSPFNSTPSIVVGDEIGGLAACSVTGGTLEAMFTDIGHAAGSIGILRVSGIGAALVSDFHVRVGREGSGFLDVLGGGEVSGLQGVIGLENDAFGVATVAGAGSLWTSEATLKIAQQGVGELLILDGGVVSSGSGIIAQEPDSLGAVTVSGAGSSWIIDGPLDIGMNGFGELNIQGGATVTNEVFATVGTFGGIGEVTVSGPGSTWVVNGDLYIVFLFFSTGRWKLSAGGKVVVNGDLFRGGPFGVDPLQTVIELGSSGDYQEAAISVTGMTGAFIVRVQLINGFVPQPGDAFVIAAADLSLGQFLFDLPKLPPPLIWQVVQDANTVQLRVGPVSGDLDNNFVVNVLDLIIMLLAFGDCPPACPSDLNGDGTVDRLDLIILLENFG